MSTSTVFCDVCAREVHLTCTAEPLHQGEANLPDSPELVCLTFGSRCAGNRCPISGLPAVVMGVRLARSQIPADEPQPTIQMHCSGCEQLVEMNILDNVSAYCPGCGTTNRWFQLNMGEEEYVVATPERP